MTRSGMYEVVRIPIALCVLRMMFPYAEHSSARFGDAEGSGVVQSSYPLEGSPGSSKRQCFL